MADVPGLPDESEEFDPLDDAIEHDPVQVLLPGRRCLLVRLTAAPGRRLALLDHVNTYADGLREEPGTEVFMVSLDPDNADNVWLFEVFRDEEAEHAHRAAPGFAQMLGSMADLLSGQPAVLRLDPVRMAVQEDVLAQDWTL